VTEIDFLLGLARTLLLFRAAQAAELTSRVFALTTDPHLRVLLSRPYPRLNVAISKPRANGSIVRPDIMKSGAKAP
jgi:hypothetical protein